MSFFRFLISKVFLINLVVAAFILGIGAWAVLSFLDSYTLHGQTVTVPDLKGYEVQELEGILADRGLRFVIIDSIYDNKNKPGVVIDQEPKPNFQVKNNRMLYLTINASIPPKVKMPELVDLSLRQAVATLETAGLKVGELKYVPDMAHNAVLSQEFKGKEIAAGTMVVKGSAIDLILGQGLSNELVNIPDLRNMTTSEAIAALYSSSLNIGSIVKDETVKDSLQARVFRQKPAFSYDAVINVGSSVDIFITQSPEKLKSEAVEP
jgi:eukaryotic-like serine/threonine-protein kinase